MNDNEKIFQVASLITKCLETTEYDNNDRFILTLDDHGQCIDLVMVEAITLHDLNLIVEEFGDDNFTIYAEEKDKLRLVFCNDNHPELYTDAASMRLSFNLGED